MNHTRWIGDSCTGSRLGDHDYRTGDLAHARAIYLTSFLHARLRDGVRDAVWPFAHALIGMVAPFERPWFKGGWGVDPLVIPVLDALYAEGINTISSCQGSDSHSPHILFTGSYDHALRAKQVVEQFNRTTNALNQPIVALEAARPEQGGQGWSIYWHDPIALIALNLKLGVSLADQLKAPDWFKGVSAKVEDIAPLI